MEWALMVVAIVGITTWFKVWQIKQGVRTDKHGNEYQVDTKENERLREEVKALKERLAVIERITIEKESSLEREIAQLRDR